ncbi:MAG: ribonuclease III [Ignavibacteria bacterium]|nr:MAG: ribonuclease III [Ignavibacteria bacterium]KAF0159911.1 MAG: ribonuclease III [Ignavibacteria bacterium]
MFGKFLARISALFQNKKIQSVLDKRFHDNLGKLESLLGFKIYNHSYYLKALTHRSYLELYPELNKSNERLEFYGDSVLNMIVAKYLFKQFSKKDEGFLTKTRASMVNRNRLYSAAEEIGLKDLLLYNEKYLRGSKDGFQTIMADALEALIGAIDLDRGHYEAEKFVHSYIIEPFVDDDTFLEDTNYKGQLLELTHSLKLPFPTYKVVKEEGPHHNKNFIVSAYLGEQIYGTGQGKNKKVAEQEASKEALAKLNNSSSAQILA